MRSGMVNLKNIEFAEYFDEWRESHKCIQQVSQSRSGGHWLSYIIQRVSGRPVYNLHVSRDSSGVIIPCLNWAYFNNHQFVNDYQGDKYVFLVRDPRSVFLSMLEWGKNSMGIDNANNLWWWEREVQTYRGHFERYLSRGKNILIVQYEKICLFPEETITRLLKFINYPIVNSITEVLDALDESYYRRREETSNEDRTRYEEHCLKWQRSNSFMFYHNNYIWDRLGDIMIHYGYIKSGHSSLLTGSY